MSRISAIVLVAILILLAGCAGRRSFYLLSADGSLPSADGMGIGVGPVVLAEYLDRPNLVLQDAPHRLAVADDHRWAGSLEASIARVTAANLGRRLGTGNVRVYPWTGDDGIARQVTLDIRQFHGGADGFAVLEAGWRVYQLPEGRLAASSSFTARVVLRADGYDELVAAQSRLLSKLAAEIAKAMVP
jgi:uncharacterized lipoprotein YmbA